LSQITAVAANVSAIIPQIAPVCPQVALVFANVAFLASCRLIVSLAQIFPQRPLVLRNIFPVVADIATVSPRISPVRANVASVASNFARLCLTRAEHRTQHRHAHQGNDCPFHIASLYVAPEFLPLPLSPSSALARTNPEV
jgi:hypothetical protein